MRTAERALHRSRQLVGALRPRVDAERRAEAFALLRDGERRLFASMTPRDQQHCLDVYARLRAKSGDDRELLVAALLHDAGKGRVALWHRVAYVLLAARATRLLDRAVRQGGPGEGDGWRQALYRCRHHEALGAALARAAGATERVAALIAGDDVPGQAALTAADDA
jgi:hypothetical protein